MKLYTGEVKHNNVTDVGPSSVATMSTMTPVKSLFLPTSSLTPTNAETPGV